MRRDLSSIPAELQLEAGEAVTLSRQCPVLIRLPDRPWGASVSLSAALVSKIAGSEPARIGIIRDAFLPHNGKVRPLATWLVPLGQERAAVTAALTKPHNRLLVDEYSRGADGQYHLVYSSTDILRLLHREGIRVSHVPDAALALTEEYSANVAKISATASRQSTNEVLMVAPTAFGFNEQTAADNHFMHQGVHTASTTDTWEGLNVTERALREFAGLHHELTEVAGVSVNLWQHSESHGTPDAVFPNNWFSTHAAGEGGGCVKENTLVLYPMKCPNRAAERRQDIIDVLKLKGYSRVVDFTGAEANGGVLEGTGVVIPDRINGIAYVSLSERAHQELAEQWVDEMGYKELVTFHTTDAAGLPVYHSNVMMAVGSDVAIVCTEAIPNDKERRRLVESLRRHQEVVEITRKQMDSMCGNAIELENAWGHPVLALSTQAYNAFTDSQRHQLLRHLAALHHAPIDNLEYVGGGSVRCCLAELF